MAKRVAENIIEILEHDESNLKTFYRRICTDWKFVLHQDIKQHMISEGSTCIRMKLDYAKYCTAIKGDGRLCHATNLYDWNIPVIRSYQTTEERQANQNEINDMLKDIDNHPDVLWHSTAQPAARITSPYLQELIDYCKSLDFKIICYTPKLEICIDWDHWDH
jgi:hypothetical protein